MTGYTDIDDISLDEHVFSNMDCWQVSGLEYIFIYFFLMKHEHELRK